MYLLTRAFIVALIGNGFFGAADTFKFDRQAPLTPDDAVRIGLNNNPQVVAGKAGVAAAYATYRSTAALPPITLSGSHVQGTSTAPTLNGTNTDTFIDLGETFDVSGQKRYQAAGLNSQFKATKYTFEETLLTLEQQIRDAYWTLAAAQAQTKIANVSLQEAQRVYDLTVAQEQAGASPHGDVIRSSIDVANAKQALIVAQGGARTALYAFNTLLAQSPATPVVLSVDMDNAASLSMPQLSALDDLRANAINTRPLLKSAQEQERSASYAVRQAEASRFPDLGVDYQRSTETEFDTIIFTASIPLLDFGSITHSIKAARETRKQNEALTAQTRQQIEQQVAQAHADLELALLAAADYKKQILDPSAALLDLAQLGYKQGATGILPVIDAESTIRNSRVGYINSLLAVYKAQDEILAATGTLPKAQER